MAEMIGAELRLKSVGGVAERCGHHAGVGDDGVEGFALGDEFVRGGGNTFEVGEVDPDDLEASAVGGCVFADLSGCGFSFLQITSGADDVRAVSGERPRGLDANAGGNAG